VTGYAIVASTITLHVHRYYHVPQLFSDIHLHFGLYHLISDAILGEFAVQKVQCFFATRYASFVFFIA